MCGRPRKLADVVVEDPNRRVVHARRTGGDAGSGHDGEMNTSIVEHFVNREGCGEAIKKFHVCPDTRRRKPRLSGA